MPRLPHTLILQAYAKSPLLPLLLRATRDLDSATNELRWLREHISASRPPCPRPSRKRLLNLCQRRSRGEPLQYILGSQPFGELDIKCRHGVLIPRPETEAYTTHLTTLLLAGTLTPLIPPPLPRTQKTLSKNLTHTTIRSLRILDACTGTGCIALLLHSQLSKDRNWDVKITGVDTNPLSLRLANENLHRNVASGKMRAEALRTVMQSRTSPSQVIKAKPFEKRWKKLRGVEAMEKARKEGRLPLTLLGKFREDAGAQVKFVRHDIFTYIPPQIEMFDIIISNPPYISPDAFLRETERSVRNWEPRNALVPEMPVSPGVVKEFRRFGAKMEGVEIESEVFYWQLMRVHDRVVGGSKVLLMEVGDEAQARRVVAMAVRKSGDRNRVEIWRDFPGLPADRDEVTSIMVEGREVPVIGAGKMRVVVLFKLHTEESWLEKELHEKLEKEIGKKEEALPIIEGCEDLRNKLKSKGNAMAEEKSI